MDIMQTQIAIGMLAEMALIAVFLRVRAYRIQPLFVLYVCWGLITDVILTATVTFGSATVYFRVYLIDLLLDSIMMFGVLVELAWNLLRPIRASLPKNSWLVVAALIAFAGLILWPLAGFAVPAKLNTAGTFFFHLQQMIAILRIVIFLVLAGFSHLLSIGWRDRELQVATGFGLYSIISLAVTVLHTYQVVGTQYHWLDLVASSFYSAVLIYWVVCFATREAERQEFTPQMREFLLAAAGAARTTRMTMMQAQRDRENDRRNR